MRFLLCVSTCGSTCRSTCRFTCRFACGSTCGFASRFSHVGTCRFSHQGTCCFSCRFSRVGIRNSPEERKGTHALCSNWLPSICCAHNKTTLSPHDTELPAMHPECPAIHHPHSTVPPSILNCTQSIPRTPIPPPPKFEMPGRRRGTIRRWSTCAKSKAERSSSPVLLRVSSYLFCFLF